MWQAAIVGVGICLVDVIAFARPRGFEVAPPQERQKEATIIDLPTANSQVRERAPGVDVVIAGGSLAGLWLAMLLSAGVVLEKVARVRLYQGRSNKRPQDIEVASIEGVVWQEIPKYFQKVLTSVGFVEQWPKQPKESGRADRLDEEDFPRNLPVHRLKDALQKSLAEAEGVELIEEDYSLTEHRQLVQEDAFQCIVFADSGRSLKACEEIFEGLFSQPVPREAGGFLVAPARTLGVSFQLEEPLLPLGTVMTLNWAQRRYFLNLTGEREGVLQMRLTPEEGLTLASLMQTGEPLKNLRESVAEGSDEALQSLWGDIRDACSLFQLPESCLMELAVFAADAADRPSYTRIPDVEVDEGPLVAFLLGQAARSGSASFGPGYGASGDLEAATSAAKALLSDRAMAMRERIDLDAVSGHELVMKGLCTRERQVGLGLGECIASGRKIDGPQAEEAVLARLDATLKQINKYPEQWPLEVQKTLPTLEELQQRTAKLSARCWQAMAASGPWPDAAKEEAQKTVAEAEAAAYDFGGETEQGLQAAKFLEVQASSGSAESMLQLGVMYVTANGVGKDMSKGFHWIQKAADLGHLEAQNCLGTMLRNGLGVEIQKEEAARWFEKAGGQGHAEAQFNLGEMLWDAELPQDLEGGVLLFQKAAQADLHAAQFKLGLALRRGLGVEMDIPRGMEYIEKAANQGLAEAQYFLGTCLFSGDGIRRDVEKAASLFRKAAEQGDAMAQYSLGVMHELGEGVPQGDSQAQHWFRAAASRGSLEAQARVRGPGLLPPAST